MNRRSFLLGGLVASGAAAAGPLAIKALADDPYTITPEMIAAGRITPCVLRPYREANSIGGNLIAAGTITATQIAAASIATECIPIPV